MNAPRTRGRQSDGLCRLPAARGRNRRSRCDAGLAIAGVVFVLGCVGPLPADPLETEERPGIQLELDTLNVEVQNLWVRISAVPPARQDLILTWQLDAETANPLWTPKVTRKTGAKSFSLPDTARVWGNIPRAYDFRLVVWGRTPAGDFVIDSLEMRAPACPDRKRPALTCNVDSGRGREMRSP